MPYSTAVLHSLSPTTIFPAPPAPRGKIRMLYFFELATQAALREVLKRPYHAFFELGCPHMLTARIPEQLSDNPDFSLSLTTVSAYGGEVAFTIAYSMHERFGLPYCKTMPMETCLQEAMINAIVHGNLGIHQHFQTLDSFDRYYAMIAERLTQKPYINRRVTICAWNKPDGLTISVSDEGGSIPPSCREVNKRIPHGRGLFVIHSLANRMWVSDDRHTIFMTFNSQE